MWKLYEIFKVLKIQKKNFFRGNTVKSTHYKKLAAKCFAVDILKFEILKKQNKKHQNARFIDEKLKNKSLMFFVSIFMWFARFQILICEPQSIWHKLLVLSWLYAVCFNLLKTDFVLKQPILLVFQNKQTKFREKKNWEFVVLGLVVWSDEQHTCSHMYWKLKKTLWSLYFISYIYYNSKTQIFWKLISWNRGCMSIWNANS